MECVCVCVNGRGAISIGLEKKYGLRPSCLLYFRGGRGKESIPRDGSRKAYLLSLSNTAIALRLISRWAMLEFVRHSCSALTACTCLRAAGKNHLSMTSGE